MEKKFTSQTLTYIIYGNFGMDWYGRLNIQKHLDELAQEEPLNMSTCFFQRWGERVDLLILNIPTSCSMPCPSLTLMRIKSNRNVTIYDGIFL